MCFAYVDPKTLLAHCGHSFGSAIDRDLKTLQRPSAINMNGCLTRCRGCSPSSWAHEDAPTLPFSYTVVKRASIDKEISADLLVCQRLQLVGRVFKVATGSRIALHQTFRALGKIH